MDEFVIIPTLMLVFEMLRLFFFFFHLYAHPLNARRTKKY